mgnify:CR=1 FL=1
MKKQTEKKLKKFFKTKEINQENVINHVLSTCTPLENKIVKERIYLSNSGNSVYKKRYKTVSEENHLNYQKVYHVYQKCLRKLRHPYRTKIIKDFVEELVLFVDKENIDDKSVCLYIKNHFLLEDFIYREIYGESLCDFFLYR